MHKFIKFSFNSVINYFKLMQMCLIGLALLTTIDFVLSLLNVKLPTYIQCVFDFIYKIQSLVYKPNLSILPVDFTLVVAAIEMMILAGLIVYILNFIIEFEQVYDRVHKDGVKRYENRFNKQLEKNVKRVEAKSNSFVILYNIEIDKVNDGYSISESNKKFNKEAIISEYDTKFKTYMLQFFKLKFENTSDGTLLFFDKFEECNKIFEKMQEFIIQSKEFLKQNKIRFRLKTAVCLADTKMNKSLYLPKLVKLITISIPNKIMSLGNFKAKYELLKEQPYKITGLGDYSLGSDTIEVYTLER